MKKLIIFGAGNFAELAHYLFKNDSDYNVEAFCVDGEYLKGTSMNGIPIIPSEDLTSHFPSSEYSIFVAIGVQNLNMAREEKCRFIRSLGYELESYVSSKAIIANDFKIKPNSMIMEQTIIHPFVQVGENTIIWSASRIALKSIIGDNCWITNATLGESVQLGNNSFVGLESTISPFVKVGAFSLLCTRSLVLKSVGDYSVFGPGNKKPSNAKSTKVLHLIN